MAHQESIFESLWKIGVPGKHHRAGPAAPRDANRRLGTRFDSKFVPVIVDESKSGRRRRRRREG